ncbi:M13 family metallopeptidase N-terminal domain-containing protein [Azospirillum sp. B4]|uniref:M13 family metallopeptidase N-terminal domain-containing protein n=1 Tax=Azospirillum sp. B4 TaxID=95605 RepID=UPI000344FFB1|nr:M13 family metallopeptidase N-terminal domain-containing protein [Azospirillum sp. B4]
MSGVRSLTTSAALAALIAAGLAGCQSTDTGKAPAPPPAPPAKPAAISTPAAPGLPVVDDGISPCENFFLHACSVWNKANPIPADQPRWGSFNKLADDNLALLHDELEKLAAHPTPESQRVGDFYAACMDEKGIEARGLAPLRPWLDRINGLKGKKGLSKLLIDLHMAGVNAFHRVGQQQDYKDATQVIAGVYQGGLGLPDKPYYFRDDDKSKQQRAAYVAHIQKMMELAGQKDAAARAQTVMRVETQLADASMDRTTMREPENRYHLKTFAELQALDPAINWTAYIHGAGLKPPATLNVSNPDFMKRESALIHSLSLDDIKTYLTWRTLSAYADWLPDAFVQENFNFYERTMRGAKEMKPRWKRCVSATDNALGEDLGKYFVARAFGPEKKARMLQMVADIRRSLDETFPR